MRSTVRTAELAGLHEDEQDYLVGTKPKDPRGATPLGPGFVFVSKTSGVVWEGEAPVYIAKTMLMVEVN